MGKGNPMKSENVIEEWLDIYREMLCFVNRVYDAYEDGIKRIANN